MTEPIPVVIADTSALVALFNDNDEHHKAVREGLAQTGRSEEHTSELQSPCNLVCRLLLEQMSNDHTKLSIRPSSDACTHTLRAAGCLVLFALSFFFNDTATTEIYTLSLHDALPISGEKLEHRTRKYTSLCNVFLRH